MTNKLFLKPNILMEPLVNRWYAWSNLVAPATFAMNTANFHVKIMKSFIRSPEVHAAALEDPSMRGGPFLDMAEDRVAEVEAFLAETERRLEPNLGFAAAVRELDALLQREAAGGTLEPLYPQVPDPLKGFVELVYDVSHQPSIRFIEGLLYRSKYYDPGLQSLCLSEIGSDHRAFMLSTPRLGEDGGLLLDLPFTHEGIDRLARMRHEPEDPNLIGEILGLDREQRDRMEPFFTDEGPEPARRARYRGEGVRVRYFGHATLLIETKDVSILTDPALSYEYPSDAARYSFADLPERIDYVLITHTHQDHIVLEYLLPLRDRIGTLVVPNGGAGALADPSLKLMFQALGFANVHTLDEMETLAVPGGGITGIPFLGEHHDLNMKTKIAFLLELEGKTMMCAADSCNVENELYRAVREAVGTVDWLFLGMECVGSPLSWSCGALLTRKLERKLDYSRRGKGSDCERGLALVDTLGCRRAFVYAMGMEPWMSFILALIYKEGDAQLVESERFIDACHERGIPAERLHYQKELFL